MCLDLIRHVKVLIKTFLVTLRQRKQELVTSNNKSATFLNKKYDEPSDQLWLSHNIPRKSSTQ